MQEFIAEMLSYGHQSQEEISNSFDLADGDQSLAIGILALGILSKPTKYRKTLNDDVLPPSTQRRLNQLIVSNYCRNGSTLRIHIMDGGTEAQWSFVRNLFLWHWARFVNLKIDFVDNTNPSDIRVSMGSLSTPDHDTSDRSLGGSWIGMEARYHGDKEMTMFVKIENNPEISTVDQGTILHEYGHSIVLHRQHPRSDRPFRINESVAWKFFMQCRQSWACKIHARLCCRLLRSQYPSSGTLRLGFNHALHHAGKYDVSPRRLFCFPRCLAKQPFVHGGCGNHFDDSPKA